MWIKFWVELKRLHMFFRATAAICLADLSQDGSWSRLAFISSRRYLTWVGSKWDSPKAALSNQKGWLRDSQLVLIDGGRDQDWRLIESEMLRHAGRSFCHLNTFVHFYVYIQLCLRVKVLWFSHVRSLHWRSLGGNEHSDRFYTGPQPLTTLCKPLNQKSPVVFVLMVQWSW